MDHLFFRLDVGENDGKHDFLDGGATFVTYELEGERWQSVVASGPLEAVGEVDVASGVLESLRRVHIPLYSVFDRPAREVSFEFYRMDPETITGRHSVGDRPAGGQTPTANCRYSASIRLKRSVVDPPPGRSGPGSPRVEPTGPR